MRVFVYEHLCAQQTASALAAEGRAMLLAVLADLTAIEDVDVSTIVASSWFPILIDLPFFRRLRVGVTAPKDEEARFLEAAGGCDFALVIAPEFDDVLATRCEWAIQAGCRLLGPSPEAVRLCADKLRLAEHFRQAEIPMPITTFYDPRLPPADGYPYVIKPRSGAGAQATFAVHSPEQFVQARWFASAQGFRGELIVQPFCRGQAGSVAVLLAGDRPICLPPAEQLIETTSPSGQLRYAGGSIEYPITYKWATPLARGAACAVPGMAGYFGIDFVFDRAGGADTRVIEINPRLTTSYVGLRRLANVNLMRVLLALARGIDPPPLSFNNARIRFDPDGTTHE